MNKLSINQMENISAGRGFWDGVCLGFAIAASTGAYLALTPVGAGIVAVGSVACVIREANK